MSGVKYHMTENPAGISNSAVTNATGADWNHWFERLDAADGEALTHKQRVATLADAGVESGWWQQQIAVGYEQERGLREVGETAMADYQIGCQRTLAIGQQELWTYLCSPDGQQQWLGDAGPLQLDPGEQYATTDGTIGEIRTRADATRLRLTWQPEGWPSPSTLQLTLHCPRNSDEKTTLRFHQEKLADAATREAMREHWQAALDSIESAIDDRDDT